ncbi:carbon-nitrogen hydrolase [Hyaloraphidium curvatum]|nr:carbon-nitrogen hydrolase [Hyaloraphidium curvatum]
MAPILRVAALQCDCSAPTTADNLRHIGALLASELSKLPSPPHLVLLPELFATGYNLDAGDPTNWARAERVPDSADGTADLSGSPTLAAMRDWSSAHRCVIGGTLLEASPDGHLYNTFVLFLPSGGGAAMHPLRVRKSRPASFEAFVFNGTPPGAQRTFEFAHPETGEPLRLAAAICYETVLPDVVASLCSSGKLDLLLLPFSAPDPIPSPAFPPADCSMFLSSLVSAPPMLARALGCHVLACNKAGGFETLTSRPLPFLPRIFPAMKGVGWIPLPSPNPRSTGHTRCRCRLPSAAGSRSWKRSGLGATFGPRGGVSAWSRGSSRARAEKWPLRKTTY